MGGQPHLTFKTSGASVESRRNVIKEARSNLGGAALPVNFFSTALTTADHWDDVTTRLQSSLVWNK